MTRKEYRQIIYDSYEYSNHAVSDFFKKKQQESGFPEKTFLRGVLEAFLEISEYLRKDADPPSWYVDDKTGEKIPFKNTINLYQVTKGKVTGTLEYMDLLPVYDAVKRLADEWNAPDKEKQKLKDVPEYDKPELNQVQISILALYLFEKHTLSRKYLKKTQFAALLSELSSYSEHTIRQNLSTPLKDIFTITDKKEDFEKVKDHLQEIVNKLDKLISNLKNTRNS